MLAVDLGNHAEALFCFKSVEKGLRVSIPWNNASPYDLIVDNGKQLFKIQIKRAKYVSRHNCYRVNLLRNKNRKEAAQPYAPEDFDYIACYISADDIFYIIPHDKVLNQNSFNIYLGESNRYGAYREAWLLLTEEYNELETISD